MRHVHEALKTCQEGGREGSPWTLAPGIAELESSTDGVRAAERQTECNERYDAQIRAIKHRQVTGLKRHTDGTGGDGP